MGRKILALIVALIAAVAVMMIVEMLNALQIPPPSAQTMADPEAIRAYMASAPAKAYIVVLIGYILASFTGGYVVSKMSHQQGSPILLPIIVGGLLTIGGFANFMMLPGQPMWFMVLAILVFLPLTLIGHRLAR